MTYKTIAIIALQAMIAISANSFASQKVIFSETLAPQQSDDTNSAKRGFRCPRCGETISFNYRTWQKSNGQQPELEDKIAEIIDDLTSEQRETIHDITLQSRKKIGQYRAQRKVLHDTIHNILRLPGDQSETLFPLFDRSALLRADIDKELYLTRQRISSVLTEEQLHKLHEKMVAESPHNATADKKKNMHRKANKNQKRRKK